MIPKICWWDFFKTLDSWGNTWQNHVIDCFETLKTSNLALTRRQLRTTTLSRSLLKPRSNPEWSNMIETSPLRRWFHTERFPSSVVARRLGATCLPRRRNIFGYWTCKTSRLFRRGLFVCFHFSGSSNCLGKCSKEGTGEDRDREGLPRVDTGLQKKTRLINFLYLISGVLCESIPRRIGTAFPLECLLPFVCVNSC